jgi:histone H3/H4
MSQQNDADDIDKLIEERNNRVRNYQKRLINVSRLRDYIKQKKCEITDETIDAIERKLHEMIDNAIYRTKSNKRVTIRPYDL